MLNIRQASYSPVHDHIFGFESWVHSGRLVHVEYVLDTPEVHFGDIGTHQRWQVSHDQTNENTILAPTDEPPCFLVPNAFIVTQPGESYGFRPWEFHESLANEPTLTIMRKEGLDEMRQGTDCAGASVMVPVGSAPDNDFNREAHDAAALWVLIEEAYP